MLYLIDDDFRFVPHGARAPELPAPLRTPKALSVVGLAATTLAIAAFTSALVHKTVPVEPENVLLLVACSAAAAALAAAVCGALARSGGALETTPRSVQGLASALALPAMVLFLFLWVTASNPFIGLRVLAVGALPLAGAATAWAHGSSASRWIATGESRERAVGLVAAAIATSSLVLLALWPEEWCNYGSSYSNIVCRPHDVSGTETAARLAIVFLSTSALGLGVVGAVLARRHTYARSAFLRDAEEGALDGYVVRADGEHNVVFRVTPAREGYRASANDEQPLLRYRVA